MYRYTEAFCHFSWNFPEAKISSSLTLQYSENKNRKIWKIEKSREKNVENMDKKLSDKNDPKWDETRTKKTDPRYNYNRKDRGKKSKNNKMESHESKTIFLSRSAGGTLCIPGQVCPLSRRSLVLTCIVLLEIEEEQLYSLFLSYTVETETKLVPPWKTPGFSPKIRLPSTTNTIPVPEPR